MNSSIDTHYFFAVASVKITNKSLLHFFQGDKL